MFIKLTIFALVVAGAVFSPAAAYAAGHGEGHTPQITDLIPYVINFLIYLFVIWYFAKKPFCNAWSARREQISADMKKAAAEYDTADAKLQGAMQRIANLTSEQERLAREIAKETEHESEQLLIDARARSGRIIEQAKVTIAREERAAEAAVRKEIAELVLQRVRAKLAGELDVNSDKPLRDAVLGGVRGLLSERV